MIRPARRDDIGQLVDIGRQFHAASQFNAVPYCPDSTRRSLEYLIENALVFVAEHHGRIVGTIGGSIGPLYFNDAYLSGQEVFWFVEPEHRHGSAGARLLFAIEQAAREAGSHFWTMLALEGLEPLGNLYRKAGYTLTEHSHTKAL